MDQQDLLKRFIFEKMSIRGELVHLTDSFQTILEQHSYPPAIRRLLGEALVVAVLLSAIIKFKGRLTVQFQGKGQLKLLLVQCNNHFQLRGLAQWKGDLSYEDLMDAFQEGLLAIILDSELAKSRYQGVVAWRGNSFVESIEGYFRDSEQLATKLWLAVDETKAAGVLLQVVPSAKEMREIEKETLDLQWEHIIHLTSTLSSAELLECDHEALLRKLYPEEEIRVFPATPVIFRCTCSLKRSEEAILLLSKEEAEEELQDKQKIVVTCDFCNKEYHFNRADIEKLFARKGKPPSGTQLH